MEGEELVTQARELGTQGVPTFFSCPQVLISSNDGRGGSSADLPARNSGMTTGGERCSVMQARRETGRSASSATRAHPIEADSLVQAEVGSTATLAPGQGHELQRQREEEMGVAPRAAAGGRTYVRQPVHLGDVT